MIPEDPIMLLSFINMKLRDGYDSFSSLCEDLELKEEEIAAKLRAVGCEYDPEHNCFR